MKDIDFLPEWYKSGKRREVGYRTQYIALGGIFLLMSVWSFATTHTISQARAELADLSEAHVRAESVSDQATELENKLRSLQNKFRYSEEIDSKIDVASVLGEMSYLIGDGVILSRVELVAEKFPKERKNKTLPTAGVVVRAVRVKADEKEDLPLGNVRFKVTIAGVAANAGDVAILICKLEDSPYFWQVVPSFTRSAEVQLNRVGSGAVQKTPDVRNGIADVAASIQVSEFEIHCYLANYQKL